MFTRFSIDDALEKTIPDWLPDPWRELIKLRESARLAAILSSPFIAGFICLVRKFGFWASFWTFLIASLLLFVIMAVVASTMDKRNEKRRKARAKSTSASAKGFVVIPAVISYYLKIIEFKSKDTTRRLRVPAILDEKPVWEIGADVFSNSPVLTTADIDEGIQVIGSGAFQNCRELFLVNVPESVTQIGIDAFNGCEKLQELRLPEGLIKIEEFAFFGCFGLRCVVIPRSVSTIGKNAFPKTTRLLVFPNSYAEAWARDAKYNYQRII